MADDRMEHLRKKARDQADRVRRDQEIEAAKLADWCKQLAQSDLSAWKGIIEAAINSGERRITANHYQGASFYSVGFFGSLKTGHVKVRGLDKVFSQPGKRRLLRIYVEELQNLLGSPFNVHHNDDTDNFASENISIDWH